MPATKKQRRAAGRELRLRREGEVEKEKNRAQATRPFGAISDENLRKYAQSTDKEIAKLRRRLKETGSIEHAMRLMRAIRQKEEEDASS